MNHLSSLQPALIEWLVETTVDVALLVGALLVVQIALGRWLSPGWRYRLWLLVVARLVLPALPPDPLAAVTPGALEVVAQRSPRQWIADRRPPPAPSIPASPRAGAPAVPERRSEDGVLGGSATRGSEGEVASAAPASRAEEARGTPSASRQLHGMTPQAAVAERELLAEGPPSAEPGPGLSRSAGRAALLLWGCGAVLFGLWLVVRETAFRVRLARGARCTDPRLDGLLEECRAELRVQRKVVLVLTPMVPSPGIVGLLRPRLLLPPALVPHLSREDLRHVFLHELTHLRRGDLAVQWVLAVLQVVHWFNPLVWLAFARLRAAQELLCDREALRASPSARPVRYARTLLKLAVACRGGIRPASAVGVLPGRREARRRIEMITEFAVPSRRSFAVGASLMLLLGWAALTRAAPVASPLPGAEPLTGQATDRIQVVRQERPAPWRGELRDKLAIEISAAFESAPFDEVIAFFRQATGANIVLDPDSMDWAGEVLINFHVEGRSAADVLKMTTALCDLDYCLHQGAVFIGVPESLPRSVELRLYRVEPLVFDEGVADEERAGRLYYLIQELVAPESWEEWPQRSIHHWNGLLGITQTPEVHDRIELFLTALLNRGQVPAGPLPDWQARVDAALRLPCTLELRDVALSMALEALTEIAGVPVLADKGLDCDVDVDLQVAEMPLAQVIDWVARLAGARWESRDGAIWLTERISMEIGYYPVGDLIDYDARDEESRDEELERIAEFLEASAVPDFDEYGGASLNFWEDLMLVSHTADVHQRIAAFLAALRQARGA